MQKKVSDDVLNLIMPLRKNFLFFYYPSDEYMCYLTDLDELDFYNEIDCGDLFEGNDKRERIMIFHLYY